MCGFEEKDKGSLFKYYHKFICSFIIIKLTPNWIDYFLGYSEWALGKTSYRVNLLSNLMFLNIFLPVLGIISLCFTKSRFSKKAIIKVCCMRRVIGEGFLQCSWTGILKVTVYPLISLVRLAFILAISRSYTPWNAEFLLGHSESLESQNRVGLFFSFIRFCSGIVNLERERTSEGTGGINVSSFWRSSKWLNQTFLYLHFTLAKNLSCSYLILSDFREKFLHSFGSRLLERKKDIMS